MRRFRYICDGDDGAVSSGLVGGNGGGFRVDEDEEEPPGNEPFTRKSSSGGSVLALMDGRQQGCAAASTGSRADTGRSAVLRRIHQCLRPCEYRASAHDPASIPAGFRRISSSFIHTRARGSSRTAAGFAGQHTRRTPHAARPIADHTAREHRPAAQLRPGART